MEQLDYLTPHVFVEESLASGGAEDRPAFPNETGNGGMVQLHQVLSFPPQPVVSDVRLDFSPQRAYGKLPVLNSFANPGQPLITVLERDDPNAVLTRTVLTPMGGQNPKTSGLSET